MALESSWGSSMACKVLLYGALKLLVQNHCFGNLHFCFAFCRIWLRILFLVPCLWQETKPFCSLENTFSKKNAPPLEKSKYFGATVRQQVQVRWRFSLQCLKLSASFGRIFLQILRRQKTPSFFSKEFAKSEETSFPDSSEVSSCHCCQPLLHPASLWSFCRRCSHVCRRTFHCCQRLFHASSSSFCRRFSHVCKRKRKQTKLFHESWQLKVYCAFQHTVHLPCHRFFCKVRTMKFNNAIERKENDLDEYNFFVSDWTALSQLKVMPTNKQVNICTKTNCSLFWRATSLPHATNQILSNVAWELSKCYLGKCGQEKPFVQSQQYSKSWNLQTVFSFSRACKPGALPLPAGLLSACTFCTNKQKKTGWVVARTLKTQVRITGKGFWHGSNVT